MCERRGYTRQFSEQGDFETASEMGSTSTCNFISHRGYDERVGEAVTRVKEAVMSMWGGAVTRF